MNEELLLRGARDADWTLPLPPASAIRAGAARRRRIRRSSALAAGALVVAAVASLAGHVRGSDEVTAADSGRGEAEVGAFVLGYVPDDWSVSQRARSDAAAVACLGPATAPCAVQVHAAADPAVDAELRWFATLTAPCASPSTTTVRSYATHHSSGPARRYSVECPMPGGEAYRNVAWVLDAGVAVVPSATSDVAAARKIVDGIRPAGTLPALPSTTPSATPSAP